MPHISIEDVFVQKLEHPVFSQYNVDVSIVRLDKIHPIISGNKWFKLMGYLQDARQKGYSAIATFGGAYSNHIVATAAACKQQGLNCLGFIRGEEPAVYSHTLQEAKNMGMNLCFLSRKDYLLKNLEVLENQFPGYYFIREGGYGNLGTLGIQNMYQWIDQEAQYILAACGTGTTLAGLIRFALPHQEVIGFNVLKGHEAMSEDILKLLPAEYADKGWRIINDYHFGGYAKKNEVLINFMNELWEIDQLPTDFVYEAKMMYGLIDMVKNGQFPAESKIVAIHSGGLQGNLSLPKGRLLF